MDDGRKRELARLTRELISKLIEIDRATTAAADLAERIERIDNADDEDGELDDATILELRPANGDDELEALRAAHRDWHIWQNDTGWHAVRDAHSDPIDAPTAADLDRRLGPGL